MKRAVLYARISRGSWQQRGRNLLDQLLSCRQFAVREGWHIVAELAENNLRTPGSSRNLPKLQIMMEMAASHDFDVLIATDMDRLSRSLAKQILIENELLRFGIEISYVNNIFADTPDGQLAKQVQAVISEYEKVKAVERLCRGIRYSVRAGNVMTADMPPFGYMNIKKDGRKNLAVLEEDAIVVRLIYRWYAVGDADGMLLGSTSIAHKLSQLQIPSPCSYKRNPSKKNNNCLPWGVTTILRILKSETYAGIWRYGKDKRKSTGISARDYSKSLPSVKVPAIISRKMWNKAEKQNILNKVNIYRKKGYLLADHVHCYHCERLPSVRRVIRGDGIIYTYYNCISKYQKHLNCTNKDMFQLRAIDTIFFDWLHSRLGDSELEQLKMVNRQKLFCLVEEEIDELSNLIEKKKEKRVRLTKIAKYSYFRADYIHEQDRQIENNISALEQEVSYLGSKLLLFKSFKINQLHYAYPNYETTDEVAFDFRIKREIIKHFDIKVFLASIDGMKIAYFASNLEEIAFRLRGKERKPGFPVIKPIELSSVSLRMSSAGNFKKMD